MANTYRMANLRGLSDSTGNRKKQSMKHTAAPRMHAMNMSIRSHRLTTGNGQQCNFFFFFSLFFSLSLRLQPNAGTKCLSVSYSPAQGCATNTSRKGRPIDGHEPDEGRKMAGTYRQKDYPLPHVDLPPARGPLVPRE